MYDKGVFLDKELQSIVNFIGQVSEIDKKYIRQVLEFVYLSGQRDFLQDILKMKGEKTS